MKQVNFILVIALIALTSFSATLAPYKYADSKHGISLAFPADYEVSIDTSNGYNITKVTATKDGQMYMLSTSQHEEEASGTELEELSLENFVGSLNGKIISKTTWNYKKTTGTKAVVRMEKEDIDLEYLIFFKNNVQFQLVALAPHSEWKQGEANAFFKSIKLK